MYTMYLDLTVAGEFRMRRGEGEVGEVGSVCDAHVKLHVNCTCQVQSDEVILPLPIFLRLFYGCSNRYHMSGDNSRNRHIKGP